MLLVLLLILVLGLAFASEMVDKGIHVSVSDLSSEQLLHCIPVELWVIGTNTREVNNGRDDLGIDKHLIVWREIR